MNSEASLWARVQPSAAKTDNGAPQCGRIPATNAKKNAEGRKSHRQAATEGSLQSMSREETQVLKSYHYNNVRFSTYH